MNENQLKAELKKLIKARSPKVKQHLSDAETGSSYVQIEIRRQTINLPILNSISGTSAIDF